jgi:hypothetical protein
MGVRAQKLFDLPPGDYVLRFAVRDVQTGLIGTATGKISVSAPGMPPATTPPVLQKPTL